MNSAFDELRMALRQAVISLWRRRWLGVGAAWVTALVAMPIVLLVPNRYMASAQIYIDTQTVLKPLMQGLAITQDVEQQFRMLARTIISRPNVERLVDTPGLLGGEKLSPEDRERLVSDLMKRIRFQPAAGGVNLYDISLRDPDAARAHRIVDATLSLFVTAGARSTRRDNEEASHFIDQQIKLYEGKLVEAENRLKEFKIRHFGLSGVADRDFFARMSAVSEEVAKLRLELSSAEQARDAYKRELAGENPVLPRDPLVAGAAPATETQVRLETMRKQLDELLRRYTEEHPDVLSTRRVVAQLEAQKKREDDELARLDQTGKAKVLAATSPVYQRLRISLAETEAQVASLRSQLGMKQSQLDQLRATAGKIPQVEAELVQLNRDYAILGENYKSLVARRESASMGVRMDEESRLADFRIVEPPRVAEKPAFPSRLHAAAIAFLVVIVAGFGLPIVVDQLFPTFRDARQLQEAFGREVLGTISVVITPEVRQRLRSQGVGVAAASAGLLIVQVGWIAWLATSTPGF